MSKIYFREPHSAHWYVLIKGIFKNLSGIQIKGSGPGAIGPRSPQHEATALGARPLYSPATTAAASMPLFPPPLSAPTAHPRI